jgi:acetolactate synthase I/II/III large subunit
MSLPISRRDLLKLATAQCVASLALPAVQAGPLAGRLQRAPASGRMTGAEALVETLIQEGTACVFGIPGAQENELWA